ncbi:hypothetical protein OCK72_10300 [Fusobacterium simiae]|uniref:Uncharacterized protein n=1 Tax=Fusobacterium simiae TaxID=855 RepID=A0ABT4DK83_FUSSI|nr:hypothetical protein [Fusobacterium simiae]MCY7009015.1 hypothetical protein [Fusobacterium simiae]
MTIKEREMILNLSYQELVEKFKNELIREYAIKQLNRHDFTDKDEEEHY